MRGASEQPGRQPRRSGSRPPASASRRGGPGCGRSPAPNPPTAYHGLRGGSPWSDRRSGDGSVRRAGSAVHGARPTAARTPGRPRHPAPRPAGADLLQLARLPRQPRWLGRRFLRHVLLRGPSGMGLAQAGRTAVRRTAGPRQPGPGGHRRRHRRGPVGHRRVDPVVDHGGGAGPVRRPALRGHHPHGGDHLDTGGRLDAQRGVRGGRRAGGIGRAARSLRARRDDRSRPAGPAGRSPRFRSQGPVATGGPDAGRRTGGHRLRRQLGGLLGLPRVVGGRTRGRRCPHDLRGGRGGRREPGGDLDGRRRPGRGRERQPVGGGRQRLEQHGRRPLRRQRLGARALVLVDAAPVLQPVHLAPRQPHRRRPGLVLAGRPPRRPGVPGREVRYRLPPPGVVPRRHRRPGGPAGRPVRRRGRRGTRSPTPWSTHRAAGEWWPCGWGRRHLR